MERGKEEGWRKNRDGEECDGEDGGGLDEMRDEALLTQSFQTQ